MHTHAHMHKHTQLITYGTCFLSFLASAATTSPNADSDLLMFCASFRRSPVADVLLIRSDPARSMRFSFAVLTRPEILLTPFTCVVVQKGSNRGTHTRGEGAA